MLYFCYLHNSGRYFHAYMITGEETYFVKYAYMIEILLYQLLVLLSHKQKF